MLDFKDKKVGTKVSTVHGKGTIVARDGAKGSRLLRYLVEIEEFLPLYKHKQNTYPKDRLCYFKDEITFE